MTAYELASDGNPMLRGSWKYCSKLYVKRRSALLCSLDDSGDHRSVVRMDASQNLIDAKRIRITES